VKFHEAQRLLREAGFTLERQLGTSHQIWKRDQEIFILAVHKGKELKKVAEKKIRKLAEQ
jgi:predicted RNA binding protein YcfA (HicA-like mRNA interferase family)